MSLKEKAAVAVIVMVALYAFAAVLWFVSQESAWKRAAKNYARACETYEKEERLIAEKDKWTEAYETEKARMPLFAEGKSTDTTWLSMMDAIAATNHVMISSRQGLQEVTGGDVLELPIEVRKWDGALESLVHFMYDLETTKSGMFDVRQLNIKTGKPGYLTGSFVLTCAYMRD